MHAVVMRRHGGPEVLEYTEVADPEPGPGEVLVEVHAVGVNFRDVYEREGEAPGIELPAVTGAEGAGVVMGSGARVAWARMPGSYAERIALPRDRLVPIPDRVPLEMAAAVLLQGMTADYLVSDSYPVEPRDWVLVHAAAGGVGLLLTQLAALRGGRVIGTVSSPEKEHLARAAGAEALIGYSRFADQVMEITGGEGVAAVYDGVGRATFLGGLEALRPLGRMILYGEASGRPDPLDVNLLRRRSIFLQRPTLATQTARPEELHERALRVFDLVAAGKLRVHIGGRYPLAEARRAHEDLQSRSTIGKLLLIP
jgi:NADPH2:quinone reductase